MHEGSKMRTFSEYYDGRQGEEMGLGDVDAFPSEDKLLMKIAMMAIRNHNDKTMDFFASLSKHDENIRRVMSRYKDERNSVDPKTYKQKRHDNEDIISPSTADAGDPM